MGGPEAAAAAERREGIRAPDRGYLGKSAAPHAPTCCWPLSVWEGLMNEIALCGDRTRVASGVACWTPTVQGSSLDRT